MSGISVRLILFDCNSLFRSLFALDLCRLQYVQNSLARIVANTTKYSHITPVRKSLHWLPIKHQSVFKMALLQNKFLYIVVIPNTLKLSLNADIACNLLKSILIACCSRSHSFHHYISLKSILASAFHMINQGFRMICLMMYVQPNSLHSGRR